MERVAEVVELTGALVLALVAPALTHAQDTPADALQAAVANVELPADRAELAVSRAALVGLYDSAGDQPVWTVAGRREIRDTGLEDQGRAAHRPRRAAKSSGSSQTGTWALRTDDDPDDRHGELSRPHS